MQYERSDWTLVVQKKKCKTENGHGKSSRGIDRGSARWEGVGEPLGATGTLARGARQTTCIKKNKVKISTEMN
jgi:hypothetical protein